MKPNKIVTYRPGPVAVLPEEPVPFAVPRMGGIDSAPVSREVWRVQEPDMAELASWLVPRLQKDAPDLDPQRLASWMRSCFHERSALLIRTQDMCGLFMSEQTALDVRPIVFEKWVRARDRSVPNEQAVALYRFAKDWAMAINAARMEINRDSDAPMLHVGPALSDIKKDHRVQKLTLHTVILSE